MKNKSKFDTRTYWVKMRSGNQIVAEKRYNRRWFICGIGHIVSCNDGTWCSSKSEIVKVGDEIVCPYEK